jgi:hypothetical protein
MFILRMKNNTLILREILVSFNSLQNAMKKQNRLIIIKDFESFSKFQDLIKEAEKMLKEYAKSNSLKDINLKFTILAPYCGMNCFVNSDNIDINNSDSKELFEGLFDILSKNYD